MRSQDRGCELQDRQGEIFIMRRSIYTTARPYPLRGILTIHNGISDLLGEGVDKVC